MIKIGYPTQLICLEFVNKSECLWKIPIYRSEKVIQRVKWNIHNSTGAWKSRDVNQNEFRFGRTCKKISWKYVREYIGTFIYLFIYSFIYLFICLLRSDNQSDTEENPIIDQADLSGLELGISGLKSYLEVKFSIRWKTGRSWSNFRGPSHVCWGAFVLRVWAQTRCKCRN